MLKRCAIIIFLNLFIAISALAASDTKESPIQITEASCSNVDKGTPFNKLSSSDISRLLGWVRDSHSCNICGGSYIDPSNIINTPNPKAMQDTPMKITANKPAFFTQYGMSMAQGNVTLIQPGREIIADCVTFFRDEKTSKIRDGVLVGHVVFREPGKLMVSEQSNLNFVTEEHTSENGFYRMLANTPSGITNVWGRAKHAVRNAAGVLKMRKVTYSACPPDATSWHLWSDRLTLDSNTGRGEAVNAFLFIKKIPIFYAPYFSFPIDKNRKSGFLFPSIGYSKNSGYGLTLPYYFNLAPNYDATFTPNFFSNRGVLLDGLFNYLTPRNHGNIKINYIPHDRSFVTFRDNAASSYPAGPALSTLQKSSSGRGLLGLQNSAAFNEHWKGSIDINYTTDDYFLQDFSSALNAINQDQLFNQAEINYTDDTWHFSGRLQEFQTLHRLNQSGNSIAEDQYKRLPQLNLGADFPNAFGGLNYQFDGELVNFMHRNNFNTAAPIVTGGRFNVAPSVSLPFNWLGTYVTPKIQLQATGYSLHNQATNTPKNMSRFLPLISIDSGATFSRMFKLFQNSYSQTLEPRLFYLFVPTKNQNNIPLFDTNLPALDFNQLFRANRFVGTDRIGDANQITAAVTTRLLDDYGQEKLNASLGQIIVAHNHKVVIDGTPDPLENETLSPFVGQLQYFISSKVNATANAAWDPNYHRFNTSGVNLQYNDKTEKIVNFWYNYNLHGDSSAQKPKANLNRVGLSLWWKLWQNWNVLGSLDYNASYSRTQNYIAGLEYDSCCWAIRLVRTRTYVGPNINNNYDSRNYLQFFLKGLGEYGLGTSASLPGSISGYGDKHLIGI